MKISNLLNLFIGIIIIALIAYAVHNILEDATEPKNSNNTIVLEKCVTKLLYMHQVQLYCVDNNIYVDFDKIDSMYSKEELEVQEYINALP